LKSLTLEHVIDKLSRNASYKIGIYAVSNPRRVTIGTPQHNKHNPLIPDISHTNL